MTTPPKARIYRISREESVLAVKKEAAAGGARQVQITLRKGGVQGPAEIPDPASLFAPGPDQDGFGDMRPAQAAGAPARSAEPDAIPMEERIAAVRAENLSGRQLRMARRIAAMHEIEVESDLEAVVVLRDRGIDPFHRPALSQLVPDEDGQPAAAPAADGSPSPPARTDRPGPAPAPARRRGTEIVPMPPGQSPSLPSREALTEDRRAAEIIRIQQDIARRRRRRLMMLMMRLTITLPALPSTA